MKLSAAGVTAPKQNCRPSGNREGNGGQEAEAALIPRPSPLASAPEVLRLLFSRYFRPFYAIAIIDACVENAYYFGLWRSCRCALGAIEQRMKRDIVRGQIFERQFCGGLGSVDCI